MPPRCAGEEEPTPSGALNGGNHPAVPPGAHSSEVWEDCFEHSGIASAAAALGWTSRTPVGIGLLPVTLRNVALTAMELATLEGLFPGRLIAGVGHGVQSWMAQVGARAASPLTLLEECTSALRRLLAGERVSVVGRCVTLDDVALDWPPATPPPLMLGTVAGDAATIAAAIHRLAALGITSVVAAPTQDEPDLRGLIGFLGHEVRPLLGPDRS